MKLRKWQSECLRQVLKKYSQKKRHFLCLATPGSGKTTLAAEVAASLFEKGLIVDVTIVGVERHQPGDVFET